MKTNVTKSLALVKKLMCGSTLAMMVSASLSHAAPIIDNFNNLNRIQDVSDSSTFTLNNNIFSVTTEATGIPSAPYGRFGGLAFFTWNSDAAGGLFKIDENQSQYILTIGGAQNAAPVQFPPATAQVRIRLFDAQGVAVAPQVNVNITSGQPFSFNVRDLAITTFGAGGIAGLQYSVLFAISPANAQVSTQQYAASYQFSSFAAVPEPSTYAMLLAAGVGALFVSLRRRSRRV